MLFQQASFLALALAALPFCLAQISNDFENGWDQTTWPTYAPDCDEGGTVSLDTTTAHSGTNSMKVTSPGGFCGHAFFGTTAIPSGDVYVRVWLKATTALTANHVSFIVMPDTTTGKHIRIGGQSEILMYNRESDDATLPDLSPQGIATSEALPAGIWECLEYGLGTNGSISTWVNGDVVAGLTTEGNLNDNGWTTNAVIPSITGVYFGWESYGSDANIFWYDDVAVAGSRIGCAVSGATSASPSSAPVASASSVIATSALAFSVSSSSSSIFSAAASFVASVPAASMPASITPSAVAPTTMITSTSAMISISTAVADTDPDDADCEEL